MCCRSTPATIDPDASFVDLGGNSLSYVTMSVRLERALGRLPSDWQRLPLRELERTAPPGRRSWPWWGATLETSVALRAAAIVLIVGSHAELFELWGGAHLLLGIAGYNFGRFCLTPGVRAQTGSATCATRSTWIAVPSVVWVALALMITDDYHPTNLLLANKFLGPHDSMTAGRLWFVEVLVWILMALAAGRAGFPPPTGWNAGGRSLSPPPSSRSGWRCATTCSSCTWAATRGSRCWRSGSSRSAGPRRRRRRRGSASLVTVVLIVGLHGYFDSTLREDAGAGRLGAADLAARDSLPGRAARSSRESSRRHRCTPT